MKTTTMAENEENPSFIDNIPYEILNQIVSLIPLKEAVRTIILSSSWKHLWTPIQVFLNIDSDRIISQESGQQMNHFISTFLNTYETSYQILNLSLVNPKGDIGNQETLFLKAIKGVDKELHISFHGETETPKVFSLSVDLSLCDNDHFCSLKTLHLRSITSLAGSFLPALFSGCRNLETLSLENCSGLQDIDLKAHDSCLLQKFVVLDCEKMESVTISSAPNLKCFVYRGSLVKIVVKEVPKLCDVTLNLKGISEYLCDSDSCEDDLVPLLASLKDIEVLTLSGWLLEWLCTRGVAFDDLEFKFDKLKELLWIDGGCMNKQKRDSLACFLSLTPSLENLFIKIDEKWSTIRSPHFHQSWPQVWTAKSKDLQLEHLKMVKFFGFKIEKEKEKENENLVLLMDVLLKKAIAIKKMSVTEPEKRVSWWVTKVPQSHLKKMASTTSSCYSSKSSLMLSLNDKYCIRLTAVNGNEKLML